MVLKREMKNYFSVIKVNMERGHPSFSFFFSFFFFLANLNQWCSTAERILYFKNYFSYQIEKTQISSTRSCLNPP